MTKSEEFPLERIKESANEEIDSLIEHFGRRYSDSKFKSMIDPSGDSIAMDVIYTLPVCPPHFLRYWANHPDLDIPVEALQLLFEIPNDQTP